MEIHLLRMLMIVLTSSLVACAGYRITPGGTGTGYDVYRPAPYILVSPSIDEDKKVTKFEGKLIWLPDFSARYRVKSWNHFGKADFEFKFQDGWMLTSISDKSDNTEPMKTLISTAKELALATMKTAAARDEQAGERRTWLFQVVYDENGVVRGIREVPETETTEGDTLKPPPRGFEWPGLLGALGWLLAFGNDSY